MSLISITYNNLQDNQTPIKPNHFAKLYTVPAPPPKELLQETVFSNYPGNKVWLEFYVSVLEGTLTNNRPKTIVFFAPLHLWTTVHKCLPTLPHNECTFTNGRSFLLVFCSITITNNRLYIDPYFLVGLPQVLGLPINNFFEALDLEEYKAHNLKASTLHLNDLLSPMVDFTWIVEEPMPDLETDNDEDPTIAATTPMLALMDHPHVQELGEGDKERVEVMSLRVLPPPRFANDLLSIPIRYTGTTPDVFPAINPQ